MSPELQAAIEAVTTAATAGYGLGLSFVVFILFTARGGE